MDPLEVDIPRFFLCPISLDIMKDPVTLSTGISYDRCSIEKWLLSGDNISCPVTRQVLQSFELIPNHSLRRMIQAWCTLNGHQGIESIPEPKTPISCSEIQKILDDVKRHLYHNPHAVVSCIKKLRRIAHESATNKNSLQDAGAVEFLAFVINECVTVEVCSSLDSSEDFRCLNNNGSYGASECEEVVEETLSLLLCIQASGSKLKDLINESKNFNIFRSLINIMHGGSHEARKYSFMLVESFFESVNPRHLTERNPEIFFEAIRMLNDRISRPATKCALRLMIAYCEHGRYRRKAIRAGVVTPMLELLQDQNNWSSPTACEMAMTLLNDFCQCAEGRAEVLAHPSGLAVVSKKILRVSNVTSEKAVGVLLAIGRFCGTHAVVREMLVAGVVQKLCLVMQMVNAGKVRDKAMKLLKLHASSWKGFLPPDFLSLNHIPA